MIFNENFDYFCNVLAGTESAVRDRYERRRFNRAMLSLKCQNYFLTASFTNASGAVDVTGTAVTDVLEKPLIIRGGGINSFIYIQDEEWSVNSTLGPIKLRIYRTGSNRAQINTDFLPSTHYVSAGVGQKWSLDWPIPWVLFPNEAIKVDFIQTGAAAEPGIIYNVGFYGLAVDPNFRCSGDLIESIREQILKGAQYPRYIHIKTDRGAGTLTFPAINDTDRQQIFANTIEVPEHMLVLGFRRARIDIKDEAEAVVLNTTVKLVISGGPAFSRLEIPINALELFTRPDAGFFHLTVPHFLPKGSSLGLSITSTVNTLEKQMAGEIELLCVTA